jgi:hypothetical protein
LRKRFESVGGRFSDHPWIAGRKPDDWVFDSPFGGYLVIDRDAVEKILVLGLLMKDSIEIAKIASQHPHHGDSKRMKGLRHAPKEVFRLV